MSLVKYSKISDYKIKKVLRHFCVDVDATKTAYLLGINRNTINRLYKIFWEAIYRSRIETLQAILLTKEVEFDEAYFGSKRIRSKVGIHKGGQATWKRPVFGVFERNGEVYTELIPDSSRKSLQQVILKRVSPDAVVYSDGWRGYDGLVDVGYSKHFRVNKSKHFSDGKGVHINGIESFWSFTKRRLSKFNGVKAHFDLHLKECEWRWKKSEEQMFKELVLLLKRE